MSVAHFGLAMFILGATTVESYKQEKDLSLRPGQSAEVAGFTFAMNSLRDVAGPNYEAVESEVVDLAQRQGDRRSCIRRSASIACRRMR